MTICVLREAPFSLTFLCGVLSSRSDHSGVPGPPDQSGAGSATGPAGRPQTQRHLHPGWQHWGCVCLLLRFSAVACWLFSLSSNPEVKLALGGKVMVATVFPHLFTLVFIQMQWYPPLQDLCCAWGFDEWTLLCNLEYCNWEKFWQGAFNIVNTA